MFEVVRASRFAIAALAVLVAAAVWSDSSVPTRRSIEVIVTAVGPDTTGLGEAVERAGGTVTLRLDLVHSVAATVPPDAVGRLLAHTAVGRVTANQAVHVQADASSEAIPRSVYHRATRADRLAGSGLTGRGVTVALIDTGVAPVADLSGRVRPVEDPITGTVQPCVDFSGEGHCDDSYGHGTFMAGIIAGDGSASDGQWQGMAPEAEIVSLKVAGADGSSDVAKVLAAIQWTVSFRDQHDIRILNLSLGTDSTQAWDVDPFNYAVQRAWQAGIVVTVAASNRGPATATISKPADDPWVITVGAIDDRGTPTVADDRVPDFTSRGPTEAGLAKPDVVAPGARIVSLRAPNSTIDEQFPSSLHQWYRTGSGTSMATAVVSGGVALMLEGKPGLSPDWVKHALASTARPVADDDPMALGAGVIDLAAALAHQDGTPQLPSHHSSGLGSLDVTRGSVTVTEDPDATLLDAVVTTSTILWDPVGFITGDWRADTWPLSTWAVQEWPATYWYGNNWHGNNWHGEWDDDSDERRAYGQPGAGAAWYGVWD